MLDLYCKTHDLDNVYVVDASFFPSCGAFNPALTIAANALRVGDHIIKKDKIKIQQEKEYDCCGSSLKIVFSLAVGFD